MTTGPAAGKKVLFVLGFVLFIGGVSVPAHAQGPWVTGGSNSISYTGGNVGIGTGNPLALFDLGPAAGIKELIYGSGGTTGYQMGSGVNLGQAPNTLSIFMPGGAAGSFEIVSPNQTTWPYSSYTTRLMIQNTGNVGIWNGSPPISPLRKRDHPS